MPTRPADGHRQGPCGLVGVAGSTPAVGTTLLSWCLRMGEEKKDKISKLKMDRLDQIAIEAVIMELETFKLLDKKNSKKDSKKDKEDENDVRKHNDMP